MDGQTDKGKSISPPLLVVGAYKSHIQYQQLYKHYTISLLKCLEPFNPQNTFKNNAGNGVFAHYEQMLHFVHVFNDHLRLRGH